MEQDDIPMTVTVSLRATAPAGDLGSLAMALSLPASAQWQAGEARTTPRGTPLEGIRTESYIALKILPTERAWLSDAIGRCLDMLEPHRQRLDEFRANGVDLELFVGWFLERSGGESLRPAMMQRLADLGLSLSLDIYPAVPA
ncbi:DUF4279 domain-containing protein [Bacillus sp. NP157]|nr:DUF4279 domain-containing protein [Bacillus sp. NP157]